jgi:hypothetical protein
LVLGQGRNGDFEEFNRLGGEVHLARGLGSVLQGDSEGTSFAEVLLGLIGLWFFARPLVLSGRRERLRVRAPLRTVRESFPSHGSSRTKAPPDEEDPRARGPLGNTETWPLCAGLHWAAAPGRTKRQASLVICSSRLRRFHILSCQVRPDRRGHIRRVTQRLWLFRSSQCCACLACLTVGPATTRMAQDRSFSMFCIRYRIR